MCSFLHLIVDFFIHSFIHSSFNFVQQHNIGPFPYLLAFNNSIYFEIIYPLPFCLFYQAPSNELDFTMPALKFTKTSLLKADFWQKIEGKSSSNRRTYNKTCNKATYKSKRSLGIWQVLTVGSSSSILKYQPVLNVRENDDGRYKQKQWYSGGPLLCIMVGGVLTDLSVSYRCTVFFL